MGGGSGSGPPLRKAGGGLYPAEVSDDQEGRGARSLPLPRHSSASGTHTPLPSSRNTTPRLPLPSGSAKHQGDTGDKSKSWPRAFPRFSVQAHRKSLFRAFIDPGLRRPSSAPAGADLGLRRAGACPDLHPPGGGQRAGTVFLAGERREPCKQPTSPTGQGRPVSTLTPLSSPYTGCLPLQPAVALTSTH